MFLTSFKFADELKEELFLNSIKLTCYTSFYPFRTLSAHHLKRLDFEPITILYGGNGSGKSTALNIICEKLGLKRDTLYNKTNFYEDYLELCEYEKAPVIPRESCMITSDDVFDFMLNLRCMNQGIDVKRENLLNEYLDVKYSKFTMKSLDDYEQLRKVNLARSKTMSEYTRRNVMGNIREHSNEESAFLYFNDKIKENALYLLDEPENSPVFKQAAGTSAISSGQRQILWLPVYHSHPLAFPFIHERRQNLRFRRGSCRRQKMDRAGECEDIF